MKRDLTKIFFSEMYAKPPKKKYETLKRLYNHNDELWSIDLADMIDYKISNNKGFECILLIIDNFSRYTCCVPLEIKFCETITKEFSKILTKSKRNLFNIEGDRGGEFYISTFQNFLKSKNIQHYSRFTD